MWPWASQRTIASMIRWQARPMLAPNTLFGFSFASHYAEKKENCQ
jgi:hypothetical protein